jgi:hypothetical protein
MRIGQHVDGQPFAAIDLVGQEVSQCDRTDDAEVRLQRETPHRLALVPLQQDERLGRLAHEDDVGAVREPEADARRRIGQPMLRSLSDTQTPHENGSGSPCTGISRQPRTK